mmetsp:Transcript_13335/g.19977  ORF Transcript_13335/g.19977 Transcript_13335/m.19977 type:complete len:219 (-) Transcript_13335:995-1651(-)
MLIYMWNFIYSFAFYSSSLSSSVSPSLASSSPSPSSTCFSMTRRAAILPRPASSSVKLSSSPNENFFVPFIVMSSTVSRSVLNMASIQLNTSSSSESDSKRRCPLRPSLNLNAMVTTPSLPLSGSSGRASKSSFLLNLTSSSLSFLAFSSSAAFCSFNFSSSSLFRSSFKEDWNPFCRSLKSSISFNSCCIFAYCFACRFLKAFNHIAIDSASGGGLQ